MVERDDDSQTTPAGASVEVGAAPIDPWRIVQRSFDRARAAHDGTLFCLANGSLGVRGGFEESPSASDGSFLAQIYETVPIDYHERYTGFARATDTRVPVADGTHIRICLGDETVDLDTGEWLVFERVLDLRGGLLSRTLRWRSSAGATIEIAAERVVPLDEPYLLAIRLCLRSIDYAGPVALDSMIRTEREAANAGDDPRIGARAALELATQHVSVGPDQALVAQATRCSGQRLVCAQHHRVHGVAFARAGEQADGVHQVFAARLAPGDRVEVEKFVAYACDRDAVSSDWSALEADASATLMRAGDAGFAGLAAGQAGALKRFWRDAEIAIDGAPALEQALRFNLFHLYQSTARDGATCTAAKGLTGEGYEGHCFWDAEAYLLPAMVFFAPELARSLLLYRHRTLERARAHAREMGHARGALYAWRTIAGDECSAHYPSGSAAYHINAAVAYAIELYLQATDDIGFMLDHGAEMLFETARVWLQVGHFNRRRDDAFCIHEVTGPDEYTALVNNNFYTNRMAQRHLRCAVAVAHRLAAEAPAAQAAIAQRINLDFQEIQAWERAANSMYLPYDDALGIYSQDDEFLDKPRWDFAGTPKDHYPLLLHYHPLTIYRHQVCKQADVVLALVLAGADDDRALKRRCFDYYEPITVHDSTLSASTFCILAAEVGRTAAAERYFVETTEVDLHDLHGNTDHGVHMAAMAGSWLALAWGFGGLRVVDRGLGFTPTLPASWKGYRFALRWRGRRLRVSVDSRAARYTLLEGAAIELAHDGTGFQLSPEAPEAEFPLRMNADGGFARPLRAVIFDLDGVLTDTARLHYQAWKRLADEIGVPFDEAVNERLKGVDRAASLDIMLERASRRYAAAERHALTERKNDDYRALLEGLSPEHLLPGALAALHAVRAAGLRIALASASRNAGLIVERLGIAECFDHIVDAAQITRGKPDPEIYLRAAEALGVAPEECLGIEDAAAGIAAVKAAGMTALGIGDATSLRAADRVLPGISEFRIETWLPDGPDPQRFPPPAATGIRARRHRGRPQ